MASTGISFDDVATEAPVASSKSTEILFDEAAPNVFGEQLEKPAIGVRPQRATQEQRAANIQRDIQSFGWSPERVGSADWSDVLIGMGKGGAAGAVGGGMLGAPTGLGIVPGAIGGGIGGAIIGGTEALAKMAGFGPGVQTAVGLATPTPGLGIAKTGIQKYGSDLMGLIGDAIMHKTLGWHGSFLARKGMRALEKSKPVDVAGLERAIGVKAAKEPMLAGETKFQEEARDAIAKQYNIPIGQSPESTLYENAKKAYDNMPSFVNSSEFRDLTINPNTGRFSAALQNEYRKLFVDEKGAQRTGQQVIEKLKEYNATKGASDPAGVKRLNEAFDKYLPAYKEARGAAEQMFVAKAKDELPGKFENSSLVGKTGTDARNFLRDNIQNYAKTPETSNLFFSEMATALRGSDVPAAKRLWGTIGPNVNKYIFKDPAKYQEVTRIMNGARTVSDVNRAIRLMLKGGIAVGVAEE